MGLGYAAGSGGELTRNHHGALRVLIERQRAARAFDGGVGQAAVALDGELRPSRRPATSACWFQLLLMLLHHQHEVVRAAEIGDVERRAGARAAARREAEALSARARFGDGVAGPDLLAAGQRLAARVRRLLTGGGGAASASAAWPSVSAPSSPAPPPPAAAPASPLRCGGSCLHGASADGGQAARSRAVAGAAERNRHHRLRRLARRDRASRAAPSRRTRRPARHGRASETPTIRPRPSGSCMPIAQHIGDVHQRYRSPGALATMPDVLDAGRLQQVDNLPSVRCSCTRAVAAQVDVLLGRASPSSAGRAPAGLSAARARCRDTPSVLPVMRAAP